MNFTNPTSFESRRMMIKSSIFGLLGVSIPHISYAKTIVDPVKNQEANQLFHRYPAIDDEIVAEVVGAAHFDLNRVKELVDKRPELSRATWDWAFGDWETAIGAASHVGRRDIVEYLLSKGARPDIFNYTTLGAFDAVKSMIENTPGIQRIYGPHGISLLDHARAGLRMQKSMNEKQISDSKKLISYLSSLGDADGETYEDVDTSEKEKYIGDYKYGEGVQDGFSIKLNMRKLISLGKLGSSGGSLYKVGANEFMYQGAPSTRVSFQFENGNVKSLTLKEPDLVLIAKKL